MEIVRTFELPNTKLLAVKFDGEELSALEKLQDQWRSTEYLRKFFFKFKNDYLKEYGKRDLANLVKDSKRLADSLFENLNELAQNSNIDSFEEFFKPLDNRETKLERYELQKLKAKGEEWRSFFRIYAIKCKEGIIVTGGAIKLTREMRDRPHTKSELNKLELVRKFLDENGPDLISGYLDIE